MTAFKRLFATIGNEPAVIVGVIIAAVNATTVQTWQGYGSAVLAALVRFVVTGPNTPKA